MNHGPMAPRATYERFCSLLIAARRSGKLTQVEVAEKLDRPQSFVSKYESGERRLDVVEFIEVCAVLKVSPVSIVQQLWRDNDAKT
jgi:transcriptional regulator with XRE-family HTH domain